MRLVFANRTLERCARDERLAGREWGPDIGRWYVQRVAVLIAAQDFRELFQARALRLHPLKGERAGQYALTIRSQWRLIVVPLSQTEVMVQEVSKHYE